MYDLESAATADKQKVIAEGQEPAEQRPTDDFVHGIVSADVIDPRVIFGALMGAIVWNLITWWGAIPSSSSHALIGGLLGAGVTKAGVGSIVWSGLLTTGAFIVLSPLFGFFLALLLVLIVSWIFVRSTPRAAEGTFQWLQFASASLISLGHGGNDAQKTMGIIAVLLFSQGQLGGDFYVPFWVVITCQAAMGLGTLVGGWRIVHTVGSKITRLTPVQGTCAATAGAIIAPKLPPATQPPRTQEAGRSEREEPAHAFQRQGSARHGGGERHRPGHGQHHRP